MEVFSLVSIFGTSIPVSVLGCQEATSVHLDPLAELAGAYESPSERLSLKHGSAFTTVLASAHLQNLASRASDGIHFVEVDK